MLSLPSSIHRMLMVATLFLLLGALLPAFASATQSEGGDKREEVRLLMVDPEERIDHVFQILDRVETPVSLADWFKARQAARGPHDGNPPGQGEIDGPVSPTTAPIPEPSTALLLMAGLAALGARRRSSRSR